MTLGYLIFRVPLCAVDRINTNSLGKKFKDSNGITLKRALQMWICVGCARVVLLYRRGFMRCIKWQWALSFIEGNAMKKMPEMNEQQSPYQHEHDEIESLVGVRISHCLLSDKQTPLNSQFSLSFLKSPMPAAYKKCTHSGSQTNVGIKLTKINDFTWFDDTRCQCNRGSPKCLLAFHALTKIEKFISLRIYATST